MIIDAVCHPRKTASFLCLKCLPRVCGSGHFAEKLNLDTSSSGLVLVWRRNNFYLCSFSALGVFSFPPFHHYWMIVFFLSCQESRIGKLLL